MFKFSAVAILCVFSVLGWAQDQGAPPADSSMPQAEQGQMRRGPGVAGTITAINGNSISIKTRDGKDAQVNLDDKTQFRKNRQPAQLSDFKVGDQIMVRGEASSDGVYQAEVVGAAPNRDEMREHFREGMGKEFIAGEVKAINGTQLTIARPDGVSQTITVDDNTSFRKQRESITLADIKVGDHVFGRGALKSDVFVPSTLNVGDPGMMRRGGGGGPGSWGQQPPQGQPQQ